MASNFQAVNNLTALLNKEPLVSPNRFLITFTSVPRIESLQILKDLSISTYLANIPGMQVVTDPIVLAGGSPPIYFPKKRLIDDISGFNVSIYLTSSFKQKHVFEHWINEIANFETNNVSYLYDIVGDINIKVFNKDNTVAYDMDLLNAFPTRIEQIRLTWLITDEWAEQQINFQYEKMRINRTERSAIDFKHLGKTF